MAYFKKLTQRRGACFRRAPKTCYAACSKVASLSKHSCASWPSRRSTATMRSASSTATARLHAGIIICSSRRTAQPYGSLTILKMIMAVDAPCRPPPLHHDQTGWPALGSSASWPNAERDVAAGSEPSVDTRGPAWRSVSDACRKTPEFATTDGPIRPSTPA